jgi:hypothetical protein
MIRILRKTAYPRVRASWRAAALMAAAAAACAHGAERKPGLDPFAPNGTGIAQIREIAGRLAKSLGDVPPDIERVALAQIKTDPREFDAGMSRYIQAQVEETFRKEGRRTVVTSPELKTFRVVATDSSFTFTNTMQNGEELWKLGEKLRIHGFIEGSCSRSAEGDVILNLKLFRHRTGEVAWSGSFVAGPNEKETELFDLEYSVSASIRRLPIAEAHFPSDSVDPGTGIAVNDTIRSLALTQYAIEATVSEAVTPDRWLHFGVTVGYGYAQGAAVLDSVEYPYNIQAVKFGVEMLGVFFRKRNPDLGYWLGTYLGYQEYIPFFHRGHVSALTVGYRSRVSRHFSLGGGAMFVLFDRTLKGLQGDSLDRIFKLDAVAYELTFLNYHF